MVQIPDPYSRAKKAEKSTKNTQKLDITKVEPIKTNFTE